MDGDKFDQLRAKLLTSLILALLPTGVIAAIFVEIRVAGNFNLFSPFLLLMYAGCACLIGIAYFNGLKSFRATFIILLIFGSAMIVGSTQLIQADQAYFPLYYLFLPALLGTIFLSAKEVRIFAIFLLLIAFAISLTFDQVDYVQVIFGPIVFLLLSFIALALASRHREISEEYRRDILAQNEALQKKRAEEFLLLHQTSLELTQEVVQKEALQTIVNRAAALLGLDTGEILLLQGARLVSITTTPNAPWQPEKVFPLRPNQGLSGKVAASKASVIVPNYAAWSERVADPLFDQVKRAVGVPLLYQDEVLGVLNVFDVRQVGNFSEDEVRLLEMFAAQAAIVIQNVRWRERLERAKNSLEREVELQTRHLRDARDRLLQLDAIRAKMMDDISHELRTPITNLVLYADLMEKGSPEKRERYLRVIKRESNHLSELVEQILRLSHLNMSNDSVLSEGIDLNEIVSSVVTKLIDQAILSDLVLNYEPKRPLPTILGNERQLYDMIHNLVQNSILYSEKGVIQVQTAVSNNGRFVQLIIEDCGIGIPKEEQSKVFDRLYRGAAVGQRNIRGVGLGLAVVKDVVDLHRGFIELQSEVNVGTTITIDLPID